uniref:KIF-binding protein n=1 Tax=Mesocestoides corti TaxID=53468 RepID=A0A5K3F5M7_MESCO
MEDNVKKLRTDAAFTMKKLYELECCTSANPPTECIFINKYKIRGLLVGLAEQAKSLLYTGSLDAALIWGFFTAKLANNYIETEEPRAEARKRLKEVVKYMNSRTDVPDKEALIKFSGLLQYTYNSLAVASDPVAQDGQESVLYWLEKAQSAYKKHKAVFGESEGPECWESLGIPFSPSPRDYLIKEVMFEIGYTTTLLMLAQTYSNNGDKQKSADCCRETLWRQLHFGPLVDKILAMFGALNHAEACLPVIADCEESIAVPPVDWLVNALHRFDPVEWARNASMLSEFYAEKGEFTSALECLMLSKTILCDRLQPAEGRDVSESCAELRETKIWADVSRLTAEYSLRLLEQGSKVVLGSRFTADSATANQGRNAPTYGKLFNEDTSAALLEAFGKDAGDVGLAEIIGVLSKQPETYSDAACLFRWTCRLLSEASSYYTLDERCTDAIELIRAHARAYDFLASFEPDLSRRCCMQKRRVDLLDALLSKLNPQFYMVACRQIMFECGDALTALRDLNEMKLKNFSAKHSKPDSSATAEMERQAKKVNALARRALGMFERLLSSFKTPVDQTEPEFYEEEWLYSVLMAHFHSARLQSKLLTGNVASRAHTLNLALDEYRQVVAIADRHAALSYKLPPEVDIAREMIHLLPAQMSRLRADD